MKKIIRYFLLFILVISSASCTKKEGPLYRIGINPTWQPFNFQQNQGALNTFLAALLIDLAKEKGFQVDLVQLSEQNLLFNLEQGEVAAIVTLLPPHNRHYDFSDIIVNLGAVLIVPENSPIKELSDLSGRIISVSAFDRSIFVAQRVPDVVIRQYTNPILGLESLESREVDGVLMNALAAEQLVGTIFKGRVKIVTFPLGDEAIRLVTMKGRQKKLLNNLNQFITTLQNKDYYREFKEKFFLLPAR